MFSSINRQAHSSLYGKKDTFINVCARWRTGVSNFNSCIFQAPYRLVHDLPSTLTRRTCPSTERAAKRWKHKHTSYRMYSITSALSQSRPLTCSSHFRATSEQNELLKQFCLRDMLLRHTIRQPQHWRCFHQHYQQSPPRGTKIASRSEADSPGEDRARSMSSRGGLLTGSSL